MATITITVTVSNPGSGNKYYLDGQLQYTYTAIPGNTYKFDQADNSNSGHPLRLSITSDGTHNSGSAYTTGVTTSGTPGSANAYTQIEVTGTTPQTLYYYCTAHSGMGGTFSTGNSSTKNLKEMSGFAIENLSADPVPYAQALSNDPYAGAWSSGANMNSARFLQGGAGATNSAAITFGGRNPSLSPGPNVALTESYNGTAWAEVNDMNQGQSYWAGMGTNTAALAVGGSPPATTGYTEQWNGTCWTSKNALTRGSASPQAATYGMGNGTTTSALFYGGDEGSNSQQRTEEFDGTNWTEVNDLNTGRGYGAGFGTNAEAAIVAGGLKYPPGNLAITESWNGTCWSEVGDLNTARLLYNGSSTQAPSSDGIVFSGRDLSPNASFTNTESWNGTAWTEVSDLATARRAGGGGGVGTSAILSGGSPNGSPPYSNSNVTEEWSFSGLPPSTPAADYSDAIVGQMYYNSTSGSFKAIKSGGAPVGTWSSGGNTNTGRRYLGGVGSKTAGLIFGGANPGNIANTESYNGTAWSEVNDLNAVQIAMGTAGTSTSGMSALGATSPNTRVEDWNGTCWSSNPHSLNSGRQFAAGDGPSNDSALMVGGEPSPNGAKTETYNGSTWTETADLNSGRNQLAGVGTVTAFLAVGGYPSEQDAELWNGTSWTEVSDLSNGGPGISASGDSELAIAFAGHPSFIATNEAWNGTAWTEVGDLATGRNFAGSSNNTGNTEAFIASGESGPGYLTSSEEWTAADFEIKTLTTS